MKLAVMQPYLFPYIGYFQLVHAVDAFVIYEDVNYIKGGWINRNFILANGGKQRITLPLDGASPNRLINQVEVGGPHKILKTLRHSYGRAPYFDVVYPILETIVAQPQKNLALFLEYQLRHICDYLGLYPQWHLSSELEKNNELRGESKVLAICEVLGATEYINLPGGLGLYDSKSFFKRGIKLSFIQPKISCYQQGETKFVPHLSIIDVMMFNSREQSAKLIKQYDLL